MSSTDAVFEYMIGLMILARISKMCLLRVYIYIYIHRDTHIYMYIYQYIYAYISSIKLHEYRFKLQFALQRTTTHCITLLQCAALCCTRNSRHGA